MVLILIFGLILIIIIMIIQLYSTRASVWCCGPQLCPHSDDHNFEHPIIPTIPHQGERVVLANCKKALINGTVMLPSASLSNSKYRHHFHPDHDDDFDIFYDYRKDDDHAEYDDVKPLHFSA